MARALKQGDIASDRGPVDLETAVRGAWEALDADDGTGFGLTSVRQIALAHGWEVAVTESEDGGARFEVTDVDRIE